MVENIGCTLPVLPACSAGARRMSTLYVSATAGGGGAGTEGDPYTLSEALTNVAAGDLVYLKAGTYARAAATVFAVTGVLGSDIVWEAYDTTPGDRAGYAVINAQNGAYDVVQVSAGYQRFRNVVAINSATGNGFAVTAGAALVPQVVFDNCVAHAVDGDGFVGASRGDLYLCCAAYNCGGSGFSSEVQPAYFGCVAHHNDEHGFHASGNQQTMRNCVAFSNGDSGFAVVRNHQSNRVCAIENCIAYDNGDDGVHILPTAYVANSVAIINTLLVGNAGWGVGSGADNPATIMGCAFADQTDKIESTVKGLHEANADLNGAGYQAADLWVDPANGDFRLKPGPAAEAIREQGFPAELSDYGTSGQTKLYQHVGPSNIRMHRQANTTGNL